jgi:hypothetical protein
MNMEKNGFAALVEMLQFESCRLARKHIISISEFKVSNGWLRSFFGRKQLHHKMSDDDSTGTTRSI